MKNKYKFIITGLHPTGETRMMDKPVTKTKKIKWKKPVKGKRIDY